MSVLFIICATVATSMKRLLLRFLANNYIDGPANVIKDNRQGKFQKLDNYVETTMLTLSSLSFILSFICSYSTFIDFIALLPGGITIIVFVYIFLAIPKMALSCGMMSLSLRLKFSFQRLYSKLSCQVTYSHVTRTNFLLFPGTALRPLRA